VAPEERVQALADRTQELLTAAMPEAWTAGTDESDYDLIALTLDRMETAVAAGRYGQAEHARLEAYAFFEFGPERRLQAFDPGLATEVEGLVWFGAGGQPGLARLLADRAPRRAVRRARLALDERLAESAATLGDAASRTTVVTNAAIIVFARAWRRCSSSRRSPPRSRAPAGACAAPSSSGPPSGCSSRSRPGCWPRRC
jgi:high-affinity iron transporter